MNPCTIVVISVRVLGLAAALVSLPVWGWFLHETVQAFCMGQGLSRLSLFVGYDPEQELLNRVGWLALLPIGMYLLMDGRWVIRRALRGLDGTCPGCGYDARGVQGGKCPECGIRVG